MPLNPKKWIELFFKELKETSLLNIMLAWLAFVLGGSVLYFILLYFPGHQIYSIVHRDVLQPSLYNFWQMIYFSVITATTVGYGNLVPQGLGEVVVIIQILSSMTFFTLFLSKLSSEDYFTMIENMYAKTFDEKMKGIVNALSSFRENVNLFIKQNKSKKKFLRRDLEEIHLYLLSYLSILGEAEVATTDGESISRTQQLEAEKMFLNMLLSTTTFEMLLVFFKQKNLIYNHEYLKGIITSILERHLSLKNNFLIFSSHADFKEAYSQYEFVLNRTALFMKDKRFSGKFSEILK